MRDICKTLEQLGIMNDVEKALFQKGPSQGSARMRGQPQQDQTVEDIVEAYQNAEGTFVVINRSKKLATYQLVEEYVLCRVPKDDLKAILEDISRKGGFYYTVHKQRKEIIDPKSDFLLSGIDAHLVITTVSYHHTPKSEHPIIEIHGHKRAAYGGQSESFHGFYRIGYQTNFVRVSSERRRQNGK